MKKVLLIGINYKNTKEELKGTITDIRNIYNYLISIGEKKENIRILSEEVVDGRQIQLPTKINMENSIRWLVEGINSNDSVFIHYSGHGSRISDRSNDERDGFDEVLVPLDFQRNGVITDDWIYDNMITRIPEKCTLVGFFDCCHSGTVCDLKYNYLAMNTFSGRNLTKNTQYKNEEWTDRYAFAIERRNDVKGKIIMFSGALDTQTAADTSKNGINQGAFTGILMEYLNRTRENNKFKSISNIRDLLKEINCKLQIQGYNQKSQVSLSNKDLFDDNFELQI
jgi:hypothetical protein